MFDPYVIWNLPAERVKWTNKTMEDGSIEHEGSFTLQPEEVKIIYWYQFKYWKIYFNDLWTKLRS